MIENTIQSFSDQVSLQEINQLKSVKSHNFLLNSKINILTVGAFRKEKGFERILQTAAYLLQKKINFKWIICGDGILFDEINQKILKNKLQENIYCVGFQSDLLKFYSEADIYVQTSYSESFGLATLDALKMGVPVFVSDVDHMSNLLDNGQFGTLIPSDHFFAANLSSRIDDFFQNYHLPRNRYTSLVENSLFVKVDKKLQIITETNNTEQIIQMYNSKILLFISPITTQATGGIQKQLYLQTKELVKNGFEIFVMQRQDLNLKTDTFLMQKWNHVQFKQCIYVSSIDKSYIGQRINGLIFIANGIFHLLSFKKINVTHALQMYSPTLIGVIAKLLFNSKLVVKVTASGEYGEINQLKALPLISIRKYFFKFVDRFLSLTPSMKNELIEFGINQDQISVVPNSVELFDRSELNLVQEFNILYVGRISTEKSLETLLDAVLKLSNVFPSKKINLDLVGRVYPDRNNYQDLLDICKNNKMNNLKINFLGHKDNTSLEYQKAHVFVLSSVSEGMSNSLLEAMSYGIPCIVSDIPANTDLVTENINGLVFELKNSDQLMKQLTRIIIDCFENDFILSHRLGQSAKNLIHQKFSVKSICQEIIKNYNLK